MSDEFIVSAEKVADAAGRGIALLEGLLSDYRYQFESQQKAVFAAIGQWHAEQKRCAAEAVRIRKRLATPVGWAGLGGLRQEQREALEQELATVNARWEAHNPWQIPQPLGELAQEETARLRALRGAALVAPSEMKVSALQATRFGEIADGEFETFWRARFEKEYGAATTLAH